jgi:hypothetical protein
MLLLRLLVGSAAGAAGRWFCSRHGWFTGPFCCYDRRVLALATQAKYSAYFDSINVTEVEAWRPWTTDGKQRMGGYVVKYPGGCARLLVSGSVQAVCVTCKSRQVVYCNICFAGRSCVSA